MATRYFKGVSLLVFALLGWCVVVCQAPPGGGYVGVKGGYIRSREVVAPLKDPALVAYLAGEAVRQTTAYFDGLGRPLQTVIRQGSQTGEVPATDLVTAVVYDEMGREVYKYLPYVSESGDGEVKADPLGEQAAFYWRQFPGEGYFYERTIYEASPLQRVTASYAPGVSWAGSRGEAQSADRHGVERSYLTNDAPDQVKVWKVGPQQVIESQGDYGPGQLYKNVTLDEHKNQVVEYTDKEGRLLLKKVQLSAVSSPGHEGWLCTYYVYDEVGLLRLVIQPRGVEELSKAEVNWHLSALLLEEQCFQYSYDWRRRMIVKKVPGAGETRMVYDSRDRLVMSQDANQRRDHRWLYTVYDALNRPLATGLMSDDSHFDDHDYHLQQAAASPSYPDLGGYVTVELSRNFYDGYQWLKEYDTPFSGHRATSHDNYLLAASAGSFPYPGAVTQSQGVRGLVTGSRTKVLDRQDEYLYSISYYDDRARVIQTQNTNLTGGVDTYTTQYSYGGSVLLQIAVVQKGGAGVEEFAVITRTQYDRLWRVGTLSKTVSGTLANGKMVSKPEQVIVRHEYDPLGRLKSKTLGRSSTSDDGLEKLSYGYNIRGWLQGVNSEGPGAGAGGSDSWFAMEIGYDQGAGTGYRKGQFNGNISAMTWKSKGDGVKRRYGFEYDGVNRLLKGDYSQDAPGVGGSTGGMNFSVRMGDGTDPLSAYDANGNIRAMNQQGWKAGDGASDLDRLVYSYMQGGLSNKLREVSDGSGGSSSPAGGDFKDGNRDGSDDYSYDQNGNLTTDKNKRISRITYNHLNLPAEITVLQQDGTAEKGTITYTYDGLGTKLSKVTVDRSVSPEKRITTLYLGGLVFVDEELLFIGHEEGRIRFEKGGAGSCGEEVDRFEYDYFVKDHLGNIRLVLTEEPARDCYLAATVETANLSEEQKVYDIKQAQIEDLPARVQESYPGLGERAYRVQNVEGEKTGMGVVLKVMAGDEVRFRVQSYYTPRVVGEAGAGGAGEVVVQELLRGLLGSGVVAPVKGGMGAEELLGGSGLEGALSAFIHDAGRSMQPEVPRAWLNYIHFDDQLNYVEGGFDGVNDYDKTGYKDHDRYVGSPVRISKNGYLYIYVSNESELKVLFDNLQVTHFRGPLLEETHYYPFGLTMEGISSRAAGGVENNKKYNGKELNEDLDLDWYEYGFRNNFDAQIGRFHSVDPLASQYPYYTPYQFAGNQVPNAIDVDGLEPAFFNDLVSWAAQNVATNSNSNTSIVIGAVAGIGKSLEKTGLGVINLIAHPVESAKAIVNMNTPDGIASMAVGVAGKVITLQNGTGFEKAAVVSEAITDVATVVIGTKGVGAGAKAVGAGEAAAIGKEISILNDAVKGKGNFGLGEASVNTSNKLGQAWVGNSAKVASDGKTLVSKDGLRQYRPPSQKASHHATTGVQSNFEWRNESKGQWQGNGHLNITQPSLLEKVKNFFKRN